MTPSGSIVAYNGHSGADGFGIVHDGANWRALLGGLDIFGSAPAIPGTWSHLALVRTGTTTLYVDGVARGTSAFVPNPATTGFMIGGNVLDQEYFGGRIDRVALRTFPQFERTQLGYYCDDPLIQRSQNSIVHFESGCDFPAGRRVPAASAPAAPRSAFPPPASGPAASSSRTPPIHNSRTPCAKRSSTAARARSCSCTCSIRPIRPRLSRP